MSQQAGNRVLLSLSCIDFILFLKLYRVCIANELVRLEYKLTLSDEVSSHFTSVRSFLSQYNPKLKNG